MYLWSSRSISSWYFVYGVKRGFYFFFVFSMWITTFFSSICWIVLELIFFFFLLEPILTGVKGTGREGPAEVWLTEFPLFLTNDFLRGLHLRRLEMKESTQQLCLNSLCLHLSINYFINRSNIHVWQIIIQIVLKSIEWNVKFSYFQAQR